MKFSSRKRKLIVGGVAAAVLAGTIGAFAFFTSTGSGTGSGNVGTATNWNVVETSHTGTLLPGTATETVTFTVTNAGGAAQSLNTVTATVDSSGGNITQAGVPISGCSASWFSVTSPLTTTPAVPTTVAPGGTVAASTVVTMIESGTNQDPCQGAAPDITAFAS
ncbi:MAG TPA: hypothetical protein VFW71_00670 [Actinomycetota bacterium]|nr:hypothetical protein [Actinomycetota bacterium]